MQNCTIIVERDVESRFQTMINSLVPGSSTLVIGLLIGHRSENTDYIVHLARCPLPDIVRDRETNVQDDLVVKPKSSTKSTTSVIPMDEEWILHHVEQAARMLSGGLNVLGLFAVGKKGNILEAQTFLVKTLRAIRRQCVEMDGTAFNVGDSMTFSNRMLVLNFDIASKKPTINVVDCVDNRSQSSSVVFNYQKLQWVRVNYRAILDFPCVVDRKNEKKSFQKQFLSSSSSFFRRVCDAEATYNGKFRDSYDVLQEKSASSSKKSSTAVVDVYEVQLFMDDNYNEFDDIDSRKGIVKMHVKGSIVGRIGVPSKCTVGDALKCVKTDILRSIYSRIELHNEGMLVTEGEEMDPIALHQLPRRVFAPLTSSDTSSSLMVCDYLFEGDSGEDSVQSLKDVLDVDVSLDSIEDGFEMIVDNENLANLNFSMTAFAAAASSTTSSTSNVNDFADAVNKIETEKQARLLKWPLILTLLSFLVGLVSYLLYVWVSSNEH